MEQLPVKPYATKYGLVSGVLSFALVIGIYVSGQSPTSSLSYLSYVIYIGVIVLAMREYKKDNEGYMKFKKGLGLGVLTSVISSIISSVGMLIYTFVDKDYISNMLAFVRSELEKQAATNQALTDEAIDMAMGMYENYLFTPVGLLLTSIFSGLFGGLLVSLIIAAILKKDPPVFVEDGNVIDNEA